MPRIIKISLTLSIFLIPFLAIASTTDCYWSLGRMTCNTQPDSTEILRRGLQNQAQLDLLHQQIELDNQRRANIGLNLYNNLQTYNPQNNETPDAGCKRNYGQYSYYNNKTTADGKYTCDCMSGYQWNTNQSACIKKIEVTPDELCKQNYGLYSSYTNQKNENGGPICNCITGYKWNDGRTNCILDNSNVEQNKNTKNSDVVKESSAISNGGDCNDGYIMVGTNCISHTENCQKYYGQNVHGVKGNDNNSSCYCSSGYDWNMISPS